MSHNQCPLGHRATAAVPLLLFPQLHDPTAERGIPPFQGLEGGWGTLGFSWAGLGLPKELPQGLFASLGWVSEFQVEDPSAKLLASLNRHISRGFDRISV